MVNFSLEGKVAWVTGASYGIGFALATAFSEAGAKIVFNDISRERLIKAWPHTKNWESRPGDMCVTSPAKSR